MSERQYRTLTKRIVDRLAVNGKDAVFRDSDLPGFGIRVRPTGRKVYVVQTRTNGESKRVTVGRHGAWLREAVPRPCTGGMRGDDRASRQ